MKFQSTITKQLTIRIPAVVVQCMDIQPGDTLEISLEHCQVSAIATSEKFAEYCKTQIGTEKMMAYHREYQEAGGLKEHGSFRTWLVKKLELPKLGLTYWAGESGFEKYKDGKTPKIVPVGPGVTTKKGEKK